MDGVEPEWSEHRFFGAINMIIWIGIVLIPIVLKKMIPSFFSKIISTATGIILFLELLATASMVFSAGQNVWSRSETYFADGSKQFQLSKEKNVIVFIFDTLGSEYVKKCFDVYPEAKEIVKDFLWYVDARANYTVTFPGLSHELTGSYLPAPANSYYDLFDKMWNSNAAKSFYKQLSDAGYDARLYCKANRFLIGPEDYYHEYFSNIEAKEITYDIDYDRIRFCLKQMSGFSFAPYFVKKYFFYAFDFADGVVQEQIAGVSSDKMWIPKNNHDFLKKMISSSITTDATKPVLSFFYTTGVHSPWQFDEKCNKVENPFDNPAPTTRGCFYILSEFIRLLKEAKIYDNTAILICSDHGGNDALGGKGKYDLSFIIKPFHTNKSELSIDEAKVQSIDILPTLLEMTCGSDADFKGFEGYTPSNVPSDRIRKVYKLSKIKDMPSPDPDLDKCYPGTNAVEEYNFFDLESFKSASKSQSFVRQIPLVNKNQEDNNPK